MFKTMLKKLSPQSKKIKIKPTLLFVNISYLGDLPPLAGMILVARKILYKFIGKTSLCLFVEHVKTSWFTIRAYWAIYTTGFIEINFGSCFVFGLIAMDPSCFFFLMLRLIIIIFLLVILLKLFELVVFWCSSNRRGVVIIFKFFVTIVLGGWLAIMFDSSQHIILAEGGKKFISWLDQILVMVKSQVISVEKKTSPFATCLYFEHKCKGDFLDLILKKGAHPRHVQSEAVNAFLLTHYLEQFNDCGDTLLINPHSVQGNSEPKNDIWGRFTKNSLVHWVKAEAKSNASGVLLPAQLGGLDPRLQYGASEDIIQKLIKINFVNPGSGDKELINLLLDRQFMRDYAEQLTKGNEFINGVFVNTNKKGYWDDELREKLMARLKTLQADCLSVPYFKIEHNIVVSTSADTLDRMLDQLSQRFGEQQNAILKGAETTAHKISRIDGILWVKIKK